jgi:hypothetical protein
VFWKRRRRRRRRRRIRKKPLPLEIFPINCKPFSPSSNWPELNPWPLTRMLGENSLYSNPLIYPAKDHGLFYYGKREHILNNN